jgi:hypothetical protein
MSRAVLEQIGDKVAVNGVPWLQQGEWKEVSINSLTGKILCKRHNSALAPLDNIAGVFFKSLRDIESDYRRNSLSRKRRLTLLSGEAFELWMLKFACGLFYSKNAASDRLNLLRNHSINERAVRDAMFSGKWADGCGLYVRPPNGSRMLDADTISFAPVFDANSMCVVGAGLEMTGLAFLLLFDAVPKGMPDALAQEGWVHRPSELCFEIQNRADSLGLTWLPGTPPKLIKLRTQIRPAK